MCGITGIAFKNPVKPVNKNILQRMTDILHHRGPDGEGFYVGPGIGLGFRRLSIIDLKTGNQPLTNERKTIYLVCNGEIYNYKELRIALMDKGHTFRTESDSEVIVHLYEEYGIDCVKKLRGMFAFALWDEPENRLILARDRLGIKPLYYAVANDGTLYFASEQKSILLADAVERSINVRSLTDILTFGFILSPGTMFKAIHSLPPGNTLMFRHGKLTKKQYWDLAFPGNGHGGMTSESSWIETLHDKLNEVVSIYMRSDVPVAAWLSPGIDSSSVVSLMNNRFPGPVQAFSLGFKDHASFDELTEKKTLDQFEAYHVSNQHVWVADSDFELYPRSLWHCEDPVVSGIPIARLALAEATGSRYKVVMTGEGSDELFGGYPWYAFNSLFRPFSVLPEKFRRAILETTGIMKRKPWLSSVVLAPHRMNVHRYASLLGLTDDVFGRMTDLLSPQWQAIVSERSGSVYESDLTDVEAFHQWHPFEQLQYIETKTRLESYIVKGLDKIAMAHSVEARVPFLDHELVELCARIPPSLKNRKFNEKYILRKAMARHLPPEINKRKKRGLKTPTRFWLKNKLPETIRYFLAGSRIKDKGYFNPEKVKTLLAAHQQGKKDFSKELTTVLSIQIWDELFLNGCRPGKEKRLIPFGLSNPKGIVDGCM